MTILSHFGITNLYFSKKKTKNVNKKLRLQLRCYYGHYGNIVNFLTPAGVKVLIIGQGNICHIVKIHFFFKSLLY